MIEAPKQDEKRIAETAAGPAVSSAAGIRVQPLKFAPGKPGGYRGDASSASDSQQALFVFQARTAAREVKRSKMH
jgi:hypothetical protein